MICYRPFENTDTPQLAEVWRSQDNQRGLMQPMSSAALERLVLSKPNFDRQGLIVAAEDDKVQGFAHAGFGPTEDRHSLCTTVGVTSLVMTRPEMGPEVAVNLLAATEDYLKAKGATTLLGGGAYPLSPFYFGLYGGSEFAGALDSDPRMQAVFREAGYTESRRSLVLHRELAGFRPMVDRQQMQIRRQTTLETIVDPPIANWWEAVIFEPFERTRTYLQPRDGGPTSASVHFWTMETYVGAWGIHAVGIVDLEVLSAKRRQGLATYLLGESLRQLHVQGVALAEAQVPTTNDAALKLYRNLGFSEVDQSVLYRKDVESTRK